MPGLEPGIHAGTGGEGWGEAQRAKGIGTALPGLRFWPASSGMQCCDYLESH
jgi:hypothetical protein